MAGSLKLDGSQFLVKEGGQFKITNSELKLKSSGNTVVDSSGNAVISESGGTVTLNKGTLGSAVVLGTTSSPIANNLVFADGKGIDFSSAAGSNAGSSSAVFDDYEEGTFTPQIVRSTSNPSGTVPSGSAVGSYTKIGNMVHVEGRVSFNGFSGGSGQWQCSLPFTHANYGSIKAGLDKGRVYMDGDSSDRQYRIAPGTNVIGLHTPSNDQGYTSNITYLIWDFSGTYLI